MHARAHTHTQLRACAHIHTCTHQGMKAVKGRLRVMNKRALCAIRRVIVGIYTSTCMYVSTYVCMHTYHMCTCIHIRGWRQWRGGSV